MERRESINKEFPPLPLGLSTELVPVEKRPTNEEWKAYQGGMPTVIQVMLPSKLCIYYVWHNYDSEKYPAAEGAIVKTPLTFLKYMGVPVDSQGFRYESGKTVTKEFPTALSWKCHGQECENKYNMKYPQIGKKTGDLDKWLASENIKNYRIYKPIDSK